MLNKALRLLFAFTIFANLNIHGLDLVAKHYQNTIQFHKAIKTKDMKTFNEMLPNVDINAIITDHIDFYIGIYALTPLKLSIFSSNKEAFDILINDKRINLENEQGALALIQAISDYCHFNNKYYLDKLFKKGINVSLSSTITHKNNLSIETPLICAVLNKNINAVKILHENGAFLNHIDTSGRTALDYVYVHDLNNDNAKALEVSKYLIENGAMSGIFLKKNKDAKEKLNNALHQALPNQFDNQIINLISSYVK